MDTPNEQSKDFAALNADSESGQSSPEAETLDLPASPAEFPSEPFACPACGQLLAPTCRTCVACKHAIDPAEIARPPVVIRPADPAPIAEPPAEPVRYPWRMFLVLMGIFMALAIIFESRWAGQEQKFQLAMNGASILVGVWVFFDAHRRNIPRPLRWGLGTMLLFAIIFPWYLARRGKPRSPVPFVEAEVRPVTRFLLIALLVFILVSLIFYVSQGPSPASAPTPSPQIQKTGDSSPARITSLRPWKAGAARRGPHVDALILSIWGTQAEANAPSDAWQT